MAGASGQNCSYRTLLRGLKFLWSQGERIFEGLGGVEDRYECVEFTPSKVVSHLRIIRKGA